MTLTWNEITSLSKTVYWILTASKGWIKLTLSVPVAVRLLCELIYTCYSTLLTR